MSYGDHAEMSIARRLTERAATAWVSLIATALVTAGVMLAGMGATLRRTAFDVTGMTVITSGLMVMGAALAITGAISGIVNRSVSRDSDAPADVSSVHLKGLVGAAATLPVILALLLTPLIAYWRDLVRLADQYDLLTTANGPSALVFVPAAGVLLVPALEAVAAITVAMHFAAILLLTLTRSAAVLKLTAIGTVLVGGLCAGSWIGVLATERLAPVVETLVRTTANVQEQPRLLELLERHRMVCMRSAQALSFGWVAVVFIALGTRAVVRTRTGPSDITQAPQLLSMDGMDERAREKALLDAADRLYRNTPPRRF
jgi:hypothetical protein